nr:hypothetical protein BaRGS_007139 [Batillaria attramentaria]
MNGTTIPIDVDESLRITAGCVLSFISVVTLLANLGLWVVVIRDKALRTTANFLLLSLSVSDIVMGAINMPLNAWTMIAGERQFNDMVCEIVNYTNVLCLCATIHSLAAITVNRYMRICEPHMYEKAYNNLGLTLNILFVYRHNIPMMMMMMMMMMMIITVVWTLSAVVSLPPVLYERSDPDEVTFLCTGNCEAAFYYCASTGIVVIEGTALLMIILYTAIFTEFGKIQQCLGDAEPEPEVSPAVLKKVPYRAKMSVWSLVHNPRPDDPSKPWWLRRVSNPRLSSEPTGNTRPRPLQAVIVEEVEPEPASGMLETSDTRGEPSTTVTSWSEPPPPRISKDEKHVSMVDPPALGSAPKRFPKEKRDSDETRDSAGKKTARGSMSFLGLDMHIPDLVRERRKSSWLSQRLSLRKSKLLEWRTGRHIKWTREEREVTSSILAIIVAFVMCYVPIYIILLLLRKFPDMVPDEVVGGTWILVYLNSMVNPFIYGGRNPHIKAGYKRFWRDMSRYCGCSRRTSISVEPQ